MPVIVPLLLVAVVMIVGERCRLIVAARQKSDVQSAGSSRLKLSATHHPTVAFTEVSPKLLYFRHILQPTSNHE